MGKIKAWLSDWTAAAQYEWVRMVYCTSCINIALVTVLLVSGMTPSVFAVLVAWLATDLVRYVWLAREAVRQVRADRQPVASPTDWGPQSALELVLTGGLARDQGRVMVHEPGGWTFTVVLDGGEREFWVESPLLGHRLIGRYKTTDALRAAVQAEYARYNATMACSTPEVQALNKISNAAAQKLVH